MDQTLAASHHTGSETSETIHDFQAKKSLAAPPSMYAG